MRRVEEFAPAKVNLGLAVLGRRADGYHEVHSLMVTLDVGDRLSFEPAPRGVQELEVVGADLPAGSDNLVQRAAGAYLDAAGRPGGVRIVLRKELPIAAGLGGGSSDAAATLRALERLYPAGLDLLGIARALGADVPFLVRGGAAVATGVGERLEPVELPAVHLVLANPGVAVSAADAYRHLDGRFGPPLDVARIVAALAGRAGPAYRNDLEAAVLERHPAVGDARALLGALGLRGVLMSGSGSTVLGLAGSREGAEEAAERLLGERPAWWVRAASTTSG